MKQNTLDKYNLNKNWGVPFEVEKQINKEKQKGKLNVYPLIYNSIE